MRLKERILYGYASWRRLSWRKRILYIAAAWLFIWGLSLIDNWHPALSQRQQQEQAQRLKSLFS